MFDLMRKGTTGQFLSSRFLCAGYLYHMTYIYIYSTHSHSPHPETISPPSPSSSSPLHPSTYFVNFITPFLSFPLLSLPCLWHFNWREGGGGVGWLVGTYVREMVLVRTTGWGMKGCGWVRFGSVGFGSVGFGSVRFGSVGEGKGREGKGRWSGVEGCGWSWVG